MKRVVVDANIAFRALASSRGDLRARLDPTEEFRFVVPRFIFIELFKHKDAIVAASGKTEEEVLEALSALVALLEFADEAAIPIGDWLEARRLCVPTDAKDTPYVALALHLDADLWTEDAALKTGLRARGFVRFFVP